MKNPKCIDYSEKDNKYLIFEKFNKYKIRHLIVLKKKFMMLLFKIIVMHHIYLRTCCNYGWWQRRKINAIDKKITKTFN